MDLIDRIDALIKDRHLLTHPFYVRWREGTLPVEAIQEYTRQYYAFESAFPRLLSAIHTRTEDSVVRQSILTNLWDEEHGEVNHAVSCGSASPRAWVSLVTRSPMQSRTTGPRP